jgi:hypothetical protein
MVGIVASAFEGGLKMCPFYGDVNNKEQLPILKALQRGFA